MSASPREWIEPIIALSRSRAPLGDIARHAIPFRNQIERCRFDQRFVTGWVVDQLCNHWKDRG